MYRRTVVRYYRLIIVFLVVSTIVSSLVEVPIAEGAGGSFGGGDGSAGNPYIIEDVWDLQNMSLDLGAYYVLGNDIDASDTANWNSGAGFTPIGSRTEEFVGYLEGENHSINGLYMKSSLAGSIGLFAYIGLNGTVRNLNIVKAEVLGGSSTGVLAGKNDGTLINIHATMTVKSSYNRIGGIVGVNDGLITNSSATGTVEGPSAVGGIVGTNGDNGRISNTSFVGDVTGTGHVGGFMGENLGRAVNVHTSGNVTAKFVVGGIVGGSYYGDIIDSYSTMAVNGTKEVGGLIGECSGLVSNSHYNIEKVKINGGSHITVGGLFGDQYDEWFSNGLSLNISEYSTTIVPSGDHYEIRTLQGLRDLFGFSDRAGYRFRLAGDLDLASSPGLFLPYLGGELDGANHTVSNLSIDLPFADCVGLVGFIHRGTISNITLVDVDVTGHGNVGGLVGRLENGTIYMATARGNVSGRDAGGLVGYCVGGTVYNSRTNGSVSGDTWSAGGFAAFVRDGLLVNCTASAEVTSNERAGGFAGSSNSATIIDCHSSGWINGRNRSGGFIGVFGGGMISGSSFEGRVTGNFVIGGFAGISSGVIINSRAVGMVTGGDRVGGFVGVVQKGSIEGSRVDMEVTGQNDTGGLIGSFSRGNCSGSHSSGNVSGWDSVGGLVGVCGYGQMDRSSASVHVSGNDYVGGFVGENRWGVIRNSFALGDVSGHENVGGFAGKHGEGTLNDSYAWGNVSGSNNVGGLIGYSVLGSLTRCYSSGIVDGIQIAGGLIASSNRDSVTGCFWDKETSDQASSEGGTGMITAKMKNRATFLDAGWDFGDVWMIVENVTYPLLQWQDGGLPIAQAGPDITVDEDTNVVLNGANSSDDIGIVIYKWTFNDGKPITLYGARITYMFEAPGVFEVTLNVTDGAGNWDTDELTVTVWDVTSPIADAGPDQVVDQGSLVSFDGNGSLDNVAVVNFTWSLQDGIPVILHSASPKYSFDTPGKYTVTLTVTDATGHWSTDTMNVTVNDITPPEILEDLSDAIATTGDHYTARIRVQDNVGVHLVTSGEYRWIAVDIDKHGNGIYKFETTIFDDIVGPFYIHVTLRDVSGNEDTYVVNTPDIVDNDLPWFSNYLTNKTAVKGISFHFSTKVTDNVDPYSASVYVEYSIGQGPLQNSSMERMGAFDELTCSYVIVVPRDAEGTITFRYVAVDAAGNANTTEEIVAPIVNLAPEVAELPVWNVTESEDAEFDLTPYISDLNDETITVTSPDDNVTIDGLIIKVRYDAWVPDHMVDLTFSDGENATRADLLIHVVNINDAPIIEERLPVTGTKFKEGKKVVLSVSASDEDGDDLNISWWDGDIEMGHGSNVEVKLKPGEHVITLVVSDGTDQVDDTFTIVVKKEEESPGFGPIVALVAVVLAVLVIRKIR